MTFLRSHDTRCIRYIHIALWVRKVVLNELDGGFILRDQCGRSVLCQRRCCIGPLVCLQDVELFRVKEVLLVIVNIRLCPPMSLIGLPMVAGLGPCNKPASPCKYDMLLLRVLRADALRDGLGYRGPRGI